MWGLSKKTSFKLCVRKKRYYPLLNAHGKDKVVSELSIPELIKIHRLAVWVAVASFVSLLMPVYASLAVLPFQLYCAVRICRAIELKWWVGALYVLAMFVPLVSTLAVLSLSSKVAGLLKRAGVPMGPVGFKVREIGKVNSPTELLHEADTKGSPSRAGGRN